MCGLVAIARPAGLRDEERGGLLDRMRDALRHRGPDDATTAVIDDWVALGHRRLSIIDLAGSSQPLSSESGLVRCVFNGEIYNFRELRRRLQSLGHEFSTEGDGEVIVHGYEQWGDGICELLEGMFAFVLVDRSANRVLAARDRAGIKPLFLAETPGATLFASELKALLLHPDVQRTANGDALDIGAVRMHVPWPLTAFDGIERVPPGVMVQIARDGKVSRRRYATMARFARAGRTTTPDEALGHLTAAVRRQMVADVPVGAFLSGGIDSTLVVALMARSTDAPIHTFSIRVHGDGDESGIAEQTAYRLGTVHHTIPIEEFGAEQLTSLSGMFDEPFAEISALGVRMLSRAARASVKVALSGDGGDEVFGGYDTYRLVQWMAAARRVPGARAGGLGIRAARGRRLPSSVRRILRLLSAASVAPEAAHRMMVTNSWATLPRWSEASEMLNEAVDGSSGVGPCGAARAAMATDRLERLPDAMLMKVDVASMAESLEVRVPLLDDALVRYADGLSTSELVGVRRGKLVLRRVLRGLLPGDISSRPKRGFALPLDRWLAQPRNARVMEELLRQQAPLIVRLTGFDPMPLWLSLRENRTVMSPGSTAGLLFWFASVGLWAERFRVSDVTRSGVDYSLVI